MIDLISGSFDGGLYAIDGLGDGKFAEPRKILDRDGAVLRLGQYWDDEAREWTNVTTSRYSSEHGISGTAVDWDDDGDLDLLIGASSGLVFLRANTGTATEPAYETESTVLTTAEGQTVVAPGRSAMIEVADWDQDGLWDLVAGAGDGTVAWWRNTGEPGTPAFAAAEILLEPGEGGPVAGEPTRHGERVQVDVGDYDGDGVVDLLVGDYQSVAVDTPDLTDEQLEELASLKEERTKLLTEIRKLSQELSTDEAFQEDPESNPDYEDLMDRYRNASMEITMLEPRPSRHGWVWLYRRKVAEE